MRTAMKLAGEKVAPPKKIAPLFVSKRAAKLEFASVIDEFELGEVANDADVSKETVKCWKAGRAFPHGQNLMLLMLRNRKVCGWVLGKLGLNQMPECLNDPRVLNALQAFAHRVSFENDPDGDEARAIIRGDK